MNILVTGAMGHIGYSFCLYAKKNNHNIITTINKTKDKKKLKALKSNKIRVIKLDINNKVQVRNTLLKKKIDCVVHTAAVSHEIYAKKNPKNTFDVNSLSPLLILSEIKKINKKIKFINVSTGSVFQDIKNSNKIEEIVTPTPKSLYSTTKRLGEVIVSHFNKNEKVNCATMRISWVYGPPLKVNSLVIQRGPIPIILNQLLKEKKKKFSLKSGNDFRASFTYIEDVSKNLLKLIKENKKLDDIYHLGTGKNNKLIEIFSILKSIDNKIKFKIGKGSKPWSNDSVMRGPLFSKNNFLKCEYSLKKGLKKYYHWYKND